MDIKQRAIKVAQLLNEQHPEAKTELVFSNEMQLAIAVALSAQTTDKMVNKITEPLFKKYGSWEDFANADLTQLTAEIRGVNFHLGKAERLIAAAKKVLADFNGVLPQTLEQLITIPGIARKSANVILQEMWDIAEGIVVDTHITRVSNRLGLTANTSPIKIENDLMAILPKEYWRNFSSTMVLHGRYICIARKPKCAECILNTICPSAFKV